jgi:hypothetical protein
MVQPMPYAALLDDEVPVRGHPMAIRSMFVDHIDESVGATILEGLNRSDSWFPFVQFRVLGGAISRVAPDATAYAHRKSPIMVIVARPLEADELAARQWTEELAAALYQGDDGAYINFFGPHHSIGSSCFCEPCQQRAPRRARTWRSSTAARSVRDRIPERNPGTAAADQGHLRPNEPLPQ